MRTRTLLTMLLLGAAMPAAAKPPRVPTGELVLDMDDPRIAVTIAGVPLTLRVALDARDTVELNPDAAAKLPIAFEAAGELEVGRVILPGRQARADAVIGGQAVSIVVETHDARCCERSDGEIGPEQLPYARVRLRRAGAVGGPVRRYPADVTPQAGLAARERLRDGTIAVKLAPQADETVATAAAGAIIARAADGRWTGAARPLRIAFGVARPVRPLALARPVMLLGLPVATMMVRTADFRGGQVLPGDPPTPADIVVKARGRAAQHEWAAIAIGRAQLDRCAEISVERVPVPAIELRCAP